MERIILNLPVTIFVYLKKFLTLNGNPSEKENTEFLQIIYIYSYLPAGLESAYLAWALLKQVQGVVARRAERAGPLCSFVSNP